MTYCINDSSDIVLLKICKFASYEQRSSSLTERNSPPGLSLYRYVNEIEVLSKSENLLDVPSSD